MPDAALDPLDRIGREAFRTAIVMWSPLARHAFTVRALPSRRHTTITFSGRYRQDTAPIEVTVDDAEVSTADPRELGARLGRHYVYDLGLADGV